MSVQGTIDYQQWYVERRYAFQDTDEAAFYTDERVAWLMSVPVAAGVWYPKVYRRARTMLENETLQPECIHVTHWNGPMRAWAQNHFERFDDEATDTLVFAEERCATPEWRERLLRLASIWNDDFPSFITDLCTQEVLIDVYAVNNAECIGEAIEDDDMFARSLTRRLMRNQLSEVVPGHLKRSTRLADEFARDDMSLTFWQSYLPDIDPICALPPEFAFNRSKLPKKTWWISATYSTAVMYDRKEQREFTCTLREALTLLYPPPKPKTICDEDDVIDATLIRAFKRTPRRTRVYMEGVSDEKVMQRMDALEKRGFVEKEGEEWVYVP